MPWKIEERDNRYCVVKEDDGEVEGCHASRDEALAQQRALYASERKKEGFITLLVNRLKAALQGESETKETTTTAEYSPGMLVWKEADNTYRWMARYSNNFRDNDNPPEIISGQSHKAFVEKVDKGEAPLPELWLWHVPEWKVGKADWVAYDEQPNGVVHALAGGTFDKEAEWVAEQMALVGTIGVSHGMPITSLERDSADKSIIAQHITTEISPLFPWAAANRLAEFYVMETKEETPMIPENKRALLVKPVAEGGWGLDEQRLASLEAKNAAQANLKAQETEYKEMETKDETQAAEATDTPQVEQQPEQPASDAAGDTLTRQEVADALTTVATALSGQMKELVEMLTELQTEVKALKEAQIAAPPAPVETKGVPAASLAHMVMRSVIGLDDTRVDARTSLGRAQPKEVTPEKQPVTGISFLDGLLGN